MLPDILKGRYVHTTNLIRLNSIYKRLIHFGGLNELVEDSDPDKAHPVAETTIVDLSK